VETNLIKTNGADKQKELVQEKLVAGEITIAEAVGISQQELYAIAERGYQLFNSGKLEEARTIYAGLVVANPYDSVFHCHLGAVLYRMGEVEKAFEEYDASIRYNLANVDALAGRGEIYCQRGEIKNAVKDLSKAVELDKEGSYPSSIRARALLLAIRQEALKKDSAAN
jgi:tetratricopeptide (TPR) repeat protein